MILINVYQQKQEVAAFGGYDVSVEEHAVFGILECVAIGRAGLLGS